MISVFKTSVKNKTQVKKVLPLLDKLILPRGKWNFDLHDADKILRIESTALNLSELITSLNNEGFHCEELKD